MYFLGDRWNSGKHCACIEVHMTPLEWSPSSSHLNADVMLLFCFVFHWNWNRRKARTQNEYQLQLTTSTCKLFTAIVKWKWSPLTACCCWWCRLQFCRKSCRLPCSMYSTIRQQLAIPPSLLPSIWSTFGCDGRFFIRAISPRNMLYSSGVASPEKMHREIR